MTTTNSLQYKDIKKCYKARSKREKIVSQSSSGGVFYEVAKNILSEGGAVFGVAFQENGTVQLFCLKMEQNISKSIKTTVI